MTIRPSRRGRRLLITITSLATVVAGGVVTLVALAPASNAAETTLGRAAAQSGRYFGAAINAGNRPPTCQSPPRSRKTER